VESYFGVIAPRGTPQPVLEQLHAGLKAAMKEPELANWAKAGDMAVIASTPAEFDAFLKADTQKWAKVIKSMGTKLE
jgi:tripartite-type tricarboxylate transporter receptor subunit TctC